MKIVIKNVILVLFVVQLFGCDAIYKDISNSSEYAHLINTEYAMVSDMLMMSNLSDNLDKNSIYAYTITPKPGYSGRHVAKRILLKAGTLITIKSIIRCVNCPFEIDKPDMKIEIPLLKLKDGLPIKLRNHFDAKLVIIKNQQGKNIINQKILKIIKP